MIYERQDQKYRLAEVLILKNKISYWEGEVVSKTSAQNKALSITLFSFSKRKEISTHQSSAVIVDRNCYFSMPAGKSRIFFETSGE